MASKKSYSRKQIEAFVSKLENHPELYEQFQRILDLSDPAEGGNGLDLNLLEGMLRPEIRATGRAALSEFAKHAEQEQAKELKAEDSSVRVREKKTDFFYSLRIGLRGGTALAQ